jgi:diadenosine tetraphosphatase ApaH/serine/threonine PP2A family protein phosphatase
MLIGVVSDIHANLEALEVVLADLDRRKPDATVCLGDFVGYGASPNPCIERLRPRIEAAVIGNHDDAALGRTSLEGFNHEAASAARWTAEQLTPANIAYLESLPYQVTWRGARLVHASPSEPESWHYVLSPAEADFELRGIQENACFIGHSHYPGTFVFDGRRSVYTRQARVTIEPGRRFLVNVGSVGQPRDGDPRAAYLLWDDAAGSVEHVRLDYDIEAAGARIRGAGLPAFLAERLRWGE